MNYLLTPLQPENYVETTVSAKIAYAAEYAVATCSAVVVRGPAGMGKSSGIAALVARRDRNCRAFEIAPNNRSNLVLMNSVGSVFDQPNYSLQHLPYLCERLALMNSHRGEKCCLLVDEVQRAGSDGLRMLLSFHEHCRLPLVLVGNNAALKRTNANAAAFDQIEDRIALWVDLDPPHREDIVLIAKAWGITGNRELTLIAEYGASKTMRQVTHLLKDIAVVSRAGEPITVEVLRQVLAIRRQSSRSSMPALWEAASPSGDETAPA